MNRWLFFAGQRLLGSTVAEHYSEFLKLEFAPAGNIRQLQQQRLQQALAAAKQVPYFADLVTAHADDLGSFPILSKDLIREHFTRLMAPQLLRQYEGNARRPRYSWAEVKTGGSTGIPTTVIHTTEFRDRGRAARLFSQRLCGFEIGTPYFRLWGSMRDINQNYQSIPHRIMSRLANEHLLNAFRMSDEAMADYMTVINSGKAEYLMAYVDAAHELARFCQRKKVPVRSLRAIMACAGTVTEDFRSLARTVFNARVHNKYGSRDCADMACECDEGGMHVYANNVVIEIVDDEGRNVPDGVVGRVLVTLLGNSEFPIIRYEIGDIGALGTGTCKCGRGFPLLSKIEGRSVEFLLSNDESYVSPVYIRHLIGVVHNPGNIRRFQLRQESLTNYALDLEVIDDQGSVALARAILAIERDLKAVFGPSSTLSIQIVNHIPESASGKFLYTYCNVKGQKR